MNRHSGMNIMPATLLAFALVAVACGGKQTVASKSAAAYREAQTKRIPVAGGHEHGGQAVTETSVDAEHDTHDAAAKADPAMDHSAHASASSADQPAMGHGRAGATAHAQHGATASTTDAHAAHAPVASTTTHDQHSGMQHAAPQTAVATPRSSAENRRIQPGTPLRGDAFDAPNPVSVAEAAKTTQGGEHAGHGAAPKTQMKPAAVAIYACPMHPEVTSNGPGTCPKCGMTLVQSNGRK